MNEDQKNAAIEYLTKLGIPSTAHENAVLLDVATRAIAAGISVEKINIKGNSFTQFDDNTPITKDGNFTVTSDVRQVDWFDNKKQFTPLFFCDGSLDGHEGSAAMSMSVYAREQPTETSVLSVRTYKTKTGEIRASVN